MDIRVANVGSRIREARQRQNITQAQLADKTNISISHLSAIESGRSNFGVDILMRMTEALGVSADWLLNTGIPETALRPPLHSPGSRTPIQSRSRSHRNPLFHRSTE